MLPLTARRNTLFTTLHYYSNSSNSLSQEQVSKVFKSTNQLGFFFNFFLLYIVVYNVDDCWGSYALCLAGNSSPVTLLSSAVRILTVVCPASAAHLFGFPTFVLRSCNRNRNRSGQVALTQVLCIASASLVPQNCLEQKRTFLKACGWVWVWSDFQTFSHRY